MGESACLLRSFSHPSSASREANLEGNPMRALTESISFGRFMSESLAWEKWSTFSHNRYLEEVEQFSKPGTVAQKKAYFEAHYKKRAAMKAAALLEQAKAASNNVPEAEAADESPSNSHVNLQFSKLINDVIMDEQDEGSVDASLVQPAEANAFYAVGEVDNLQNAKVERDEEGERIVKADNSIQEANSKQNENAEECDIFVAIAEEQMPNKKASCYSSQEAAEKESVTLPNNKRQMSSSSKSSSQSRASKLPKSSAKVSGSTRLRTETNATPNNKKLAEELMDKKRVTAKSIHMSINFGSRLQGTNKSSLGAPKDRSTTPEHPTRGSVRGASKLLPTIFRHSQDRRNQLELNKSVSGKITAGGISQTLSSDCSKSSSAKGKSRPPLVSSPFSFRSEERAAKRKEFFQKLGEKNNAKKDTEEKHLQARPKEHDIKKLRQSAVFRVGKPSDDLHRGLQTPNNSNSVKKVPLTRPRSPKLGRKSTPNAAREASLQLHRRPSVNAESSKPVIQKSSHSSTRSVTLLPKTKAHENASPNIQR